MPVGRPDFWYSQSLVFEQSPTQGKTDAGPTSDWAYTHNANAAAHHAKYTDAEAQAAVLPAYTDRGDAADYDKTATDFVQDGAWHTWDLSAIVPTGTKAVIVKIYTVCTTAGSIFELRRGGHSNAVNTARFTSQVNNLECSAVLTVGVSASRTIEYKAAAGLVWTVIAGIVMGWWK